MTEVTQILQEEVLAIPSIANIAVSVSTKPTVVLQAGFGDGLCAMLFSKPIKVFTKLLHCNLPSSQTSDLR